MQGVLPCCAALLSITVAAVAGDVSYVVLYRSGPDSLVRVSGDGKSLTTIATRANGYGLAADGHGNYIVAAVSSLLRVTPSGVVSTIATAPSGSQWLCVALDSHGNYILGDNRQHAIWRVSSDGRLVEKVAAYPVRNTIEWEDIGVALDSAGNYMVVEGNSFEAHFWRVTPEGQLTAIPLHGEKMRSSGSIFVDADGTYLVSSCRDYAVFRLTTAGEATRFASLDGKCLMGLARNPETGELVATFILSPVAQKFSANGSTVTDFASLGSPYAIIAESNR